MRDTQSQWDESHDARVGEILNEFFDRQARGGAASPEELFAAHPELAEELRTAIELLGRLGTGPGSIRRLVAHGVLTRPSDDAGLARLGPYLVTGVLGSGGMGIVLEAYEQSLDRTVAIKLLKPEWADDAQARERFTREARAAAALKHPNIVAIHAVGETAGVPYMVMECVEGPTLAEVVAGIRQPSASSRQLSAFGLQPESIRHIFRQLLAALGTAHEAGVIHRDVKSSNILLDRWSSEAISPQPSAISRKGETATDTDPQSSILNPQSAIVKLSDFGLARVLSHQTRLTLGDSTLGTPEYMSPEQARGDANIDRRTDLYSAGVVLYEMLTGQTPFVADTPAATIQRILNERPADPRTLDKNADPVLSSLALRLLAKRPEDRLPTCREAAAALESARLVRPPPARRRRGAPATLGLAAMGALLASLVWSGQGTGTWLASLAGGEDQGGARTLLSEDWLEGVIDPDKWEAWGTPPPLLRPGRWRGEFSLDPGGDDWCPSGVNSRRVFDLRGGFTLKWKAITLAEDGDRGSHDLGLEVGICSTESDGLMCGEEGRRRKLVTFFVKTQQDQGYCEIRGAATLGDGLKAPYAKAEDAAWRAYTMIVDSLGRVTVRKNGREVLSSEVDMALFGECRLAIEGRSQGRAGQRNMGVDDIILSTAD